MTWTYLLACLFGFDRNLREEEVDKDLVPVLQCRADAVQAQLKWPNLYAPMRLHECSSLLYACMPPNISSKHTCLEVNP
jgi:hypothetical protein